MGGIELYEQGRVSIETETDRDKQTDIDTVRGWGEVWSYMDRGG